MIPHVRFRVSMHMHLVKMFGFCAWVSFSVTTRDRGFILDLHLHLGKTNRNQGTISDDDLYFMGHCT